MRALIAILLISVMTPALAEGVVVTSQANTAEISLKDVKKIFLGKKGAYADGQKALPVTLIEGDALRAQFNHEVLGKQESQYIAYWSKMVFTGNSVPPQEVSNVQEMKDVIAKNPSTVGYIDAALVDDTLRVIGRF